MKYLPMKQYRIVLGCGLVYCDHEKFSQKLTAHENFTPRKIPAIQYVNMNTCMYTVMLSPTRPEIH